MQRAQVSPFFARLTDVHSADLTIGHFITFTDPISKMVPRAMYNAYNHTPNPHSVNG